MKPLVVGQAPALSSRSDWLPLDPRSQSGRRLAGYASIDPDELHSRADVVNLLPFYMGRQPDGKYDRLDRGQAVVRAILLEANGQLVGRRVVLLGVGVRQAFRKALGLPPMPWFEAVDYKDSTLYASPHPAGTSMFWNDPASRAAGEAFWHQLLKEDA